MKKIGLIGGMSWESTLVYYQIINQEVNKMLGGFHSAKLVLESVDFAEIETLQHQNNWEALNEIMLKAAQNLEQAGADCIVICTNTMHLCCDYISKNSHLPILHIAKATGEAVHNLGLKKVLLLGTKFTMEQTFYSDILYDKFNIQTVIPELKDRNTVHQIIYNELVHGILNPDSKKQYQEIINKYESQGNEGVILGCTEIPLLITQKDVNVPVFNTTDIHAKAAVSFALSE
jgi:aspartate racemase